MKFETIPPEKGLSNYSIHDIEQDEYGFIWLATQDGLNKYDGYSFTVYQFDPTDPTTISHNNVYDIEIGKEGYLWVATQKGLNKFDPSTEVFTRFYSDPKDNSSICHNDIRSLVADGKGNLWLGTWGEGVCKFNKKSKKAIQYKHDPKNTNSLANNKIWGCFRDSEGDLWFSTWGGGVDKFDPKNEVFTHYKHDPDNPNSISHNTIGLIHEDKKGYLWIATWGGGLNRFDKKTQQFKSYLHQPRNPHSISSNLTWPVVEDDKGNLIIGTYGSGIDVFDKKKEKFYHYTPNPDDPFSIDGKDNWSLFIDNSAILWIGGDGKGLSKFTGITKKFNFYTEDTTRKVSLSYNAIKSVYVDKDNIIWLGTWHAGIDRFDPKTNSITNFRRDISITGETGANRINTIYEDQRGNFWIGSLRGGLTLFDKKNGEFIKDYLHNPKVNSSLSNNSVQSIANDKNGHLFIGTRDGLNIFNYNKGTFERIYNQPNENSSISDDGINKIYLTHSGELWIGTDNGLNKYNYTDQSFTRYMHQTDDENSLSHNTVYTIYEDKNFNLWIGTKGGLNKFIRNKDNFKRFTEKQGLGSNTVFGILEDEDEHLWISTNSGLSKFFPQQNRFINYNEEDGLKGRLFMRDACDKTTDGMLLFGGWEGLTTFYPHKIEVNRYKPPVLIISELKNKGKKIQLTRDVADQRVLTFPWHQNSFSFEYVALNYINPKKNQYAFMMENFDKDWNYVGKRRFANYTNLNPGKYIFRVKAANNDGIWNEEGTFVTIIITPPFWQTTWFLTATAIFVLILIWLFVKIRERKLKQEKQKLEEIVQQRTHEIQQQKEKIEHQRDKMQFMHNQLTDSINYAQNIQDAALPSENYLQEVLGSYFILFKPQSIVSGDYYWVKKINEWVIVTVADCTGHGVPGAFMSMLGISFMNEIVQKKEVTEANKILNELRSFIIDSLQQKNTSETNASVKDGMDISLCAMNTKTSELQFSGANNPLYIIRNNNKPGICCNRSLKLNEYVLYEIKGDKMPIAIHIRMKKFTNHKIKLLPGDRLYMFSDGFADQLGGPNGRKFMYKPFKRLILQTANMDIEKQKNVLNKKFNEWINNIDPYTGKMIEQIDDVTVLGLEITNKRT